jgi:hypothetical protein
MPGPDCDLDRGVRKRSSRREFLASLNNGMENNASPISSGKLPCIHKEGGERRTLIYFETAVAWLRAVHNPSKQA